jgi:hemolysin III
MPSCDNEELKDISVLLKEKSRRGMFGERFHAYSWAEQGVDGVIHAIGSILALLGGIWLVASTSSDSHFSVAVYAFGLVAAMLASASYNLAATSSIKELLRRADHAMIFILIAATYTPFSMHRLEPRFGIPVLIGIWLCAGTGVTLKLAAPHRIEAVSVAFYLAMGWVIIALIEPLSRAINKASLILFLAGGVVYTLGLVFHLWKRLPFHNAIWHGFVLTAAGLHFGAIAVEFVR